MGAIGDNREAVILQKLNQSPFQKVAPPLQSFGVAALLFVLKCEDILPRLSRKNCGESLGIGGIVVEEERNLCHSDLDVNALATRELFSREEIGPIARGKVYLSLIGLL